MSTKGCFALELNINGPGADPNHTRSGLNITAGETSASHIGSALQTGSADSSTFDAGWLAFSGYGDGMDWSSATISGAALLLSGPRQQRIAWKDGTGFTLGAHGSAILMANNNNMYHDNYSGGSFIWRGSGAIAFATLSTTGLTISGTLTASLTTPANSSASCTAGKIEWDANYIYVCTATNTWKRSALSAF